MWLSRIHVHSDDSDFRVDLATTPEPGQDLIYKTAPDDAVVKLESPPTELYISLTRDSERIPFWKGSPTTPTDICEVCSMKSQDIPQKSNMARCMDTQPILCERCWHYFQCQSLPEFAGDESGPKRAFDIFKTRKRTQTKCGPSVSFSTKCQITISADLHAKLLDMAQNKETNYPYAILQYP